MQDPAEPEQGLVNEDEASEVSRVHERHLEDGHDVFRHGLVGFEEKRHHQRVRRSDFHAIVHAVAVQARASASRSSLQTSNAQRLEVTYTNGMTMQGKHTGGPGTWTARHAKAQA